MKKRQILWAIVFGSMLAITGCGDDENGGSAVSGGSSGSAGSSGSGGSAGSGFCATLCAACNAPAQAECIPACESTLGGIPGEIDIESCPTELDAWAACLGGNDCSSDTCDAQLQAWAICVVGVPF
jgi:hypothetical protein